MKLYWSDTVSPRMVCAVAKYLQAPVEYEYVDLRRGEHRTPEYLALNPNGKVPCLVDGMRSIWESDAIICHLAACCDSDLWPQDARQIEVIRWFSWNLQHFTANAVALYFQYVIRQRFGMGEIDPIEVRRATEDWRHYAAVLDRHLRGRAWLIGDTITVADFAVAMVLPYATCAQIPIDEFPEIRRWHERLNELEAWREPFPSVAVAA
jgi:glutathione S-transferase